MKKMARKLIPKGWRVVRLGEVLPANHKFWDRGEENWLNDGDLGTEKLAGSRQERNGMECIVPK